ncbi:MAG: serine protease [Erysipelotrichaceae bacterium]|nr:serine protease [Erysipelotrichaceae bacterium]
MKNNRLLIILIIALTAWCAVLSSELRNIRSKEDSTIINQYEVNGFSTDFTRIVDQVKPGVVTISADGNILSGFVYRQDDENVYIISAYHGVSNVNSINVLFGSSYTVTGELVGHDIYTDIALIRISTPYLIEPLKTSDAGLLQQGEFLLSIGTPMSQDYAGSVELCMVSGNDMQIDNTITVDDERFSYYLNVIQLSSDMPGGYSGSPLFNMGGEVVGMNTMAVSSSISFALTVNEAKIVADQLLSDKTVTRSVFGIKGSFIKNMYNYEKANLNIGIETINGIYVQKLKENGLAYAAGIRSGDVVTKINGEEISDLNSYLKAMYSESEDVVFEYIRGGETFTAAAEHD